MKKLVLSIAAIFCVICVIFLTINAVPAKKQPELTKVVEPPEPDVCFLAGCEAGLYSIRSRTAETALLWQDAAVTKIIRLADFAAAGSAGASSATAGNGTTAESAASGSAEDSGAETAGTAGAEQTEGDGWFLLTGKGIVFSPDLVSFELRNNGLPERTMKQYRNGEVHFESGIEELKDLNVLRGNPDVLVTATNASVFLSQDGGLSWTSLGRNARTDGIKTAAVAMTRDGNGADKLTVFISHPIYGVSYMFPGDAKPNWIPLNDGLEIVPGMESPDEVASFAVSPDGREIFASQSFIPALYKLNWREKRFERLARAETFADSYEGLFACDGKIGRDGKPETALFFTAINGIKVFSGSSAQSSVQTESESAPQSTMATESGSLSGSGSLPRTDGVSGVSEWDGFLNLLPETTLCLYVPPEKNPAFSGSQEKARGNPSGISLSQLWLLHPEKIDSPYAARATGKKGIYVPFWQATTDEGFAKHLETVRKNSLNMIVIDMKDDYGTLRYDAQDPLVLQKGRTGRGIKLESFVQKAREAGVYLVARIVVFKDRELSRYGGGKYAVWDKAENIPWRGYELVDPPPEEAAEPENASGENAASAKSADGSAAQKTEARPQTPEKVRKYYDEFWVDPYSEEVWEYNVAVAKELIARGFDEIQFDYIRFPTDGRNLRNASYRWQSHGMEKEDALLSFLAYARQEIKVPISIDIYGANGWYRTGARTGQHMEILGKYVDVICPMFYPSHFENSFLAYPPAVERPYRIYYYGTFRNTILAQGKAFVRPWAQAFYLNVSYDRQYYNEHYVQQQIFGVRDSVDLGYTYWNNSGRYDDLRPDPAPDAAYPGTSPEAAADIPKPFYAPAPDPDTAEATGTANAMRTASAVSATEQAE